MTGASSGIGRAAAAALEAAGASVHGVARRGPGRLDVTDPAAVAGLVGELPELDLMVLAAGANIPRRRLEELTPETWDGLLAVNLSALYYCVGAALPALRRNRGQVIVVASVSGAWPDVSGPAYQAAKAGAIAFVRACALEEHQGGVRFTSILPGVVDTPILDQRPAPPPAELRRLMLRPEDVAAAIVFVASLPGRAHVPELSILPTALQVLGRTGTSNPEPPPAR